MGLFLTAVLAATTQAADTPSAWTYESALEACAPTSFDEASKCVVEVLSNSGVDRIKADHDFRFDMYHVISDAWDLRDSKSRLSVSLAAEKLYDPDASVGFIVAQAEAVRDGKSLQKEVVAKELSKLAMDRVDEQSSATPKTWREVSLQDCPKMPNSSQLGAKCYLRPDGVHVVVSR